jgi:hypothetical protein
MHRNVTAIYRTYATADLVRRELKEVGISSGHVHVIPNSDDAAATPGSTGNRDHHRYSDELHDLHLPDDDMRMYQQCVRRGDFVVSAEVDESNLTHIQKIMRRPEDEAYNLNSASGDFDHAEIDPYSTPGKRRTDEDWRAERDPDAVDPYTRSYRRNSPLDERRD